MEDKKQATIRLKNLAIGYKAKEQHESGGKWSLYGD